MNYLLVGSPDHVDDDAALMAAARLRLAFDAGTTSAMTVSSRTPEGLPNHCPICGQDVVLEPSQAGDGTCPSCGHLLWWFTGRLADHLDVKGSDITASTSFNDLGADALEVVELVMELEEELDVHIPDDAAEKIQTVGELVRYIQHLRSGGTDT